MPALYTRSMEISRRMYGPLYGQVGDAPSINRWRVAPVRLMFLGGCGKSIWRVYGDCAQSLQSTLWASSHPRSILGLAGFKPEQAPRLNAEETWIVVMATEIKNFRHRPHALMERKCGYIVLSEQAPRLNGEEIWIVVMETEIKNFHHRPHASMERKCGHI